MALGRTGAPFLIVMGRDRDFEREYRRATEAARAYDAMHAPATAAAYDAATRRIRVELSNGCVFMFPVQLAQGLGGATDEQLAQVEILPDGHTLHWEELDADFGIPELMAGVFGTRAWMAELGRSCAEPAPETSGCPLTSA